MAKGMAHLCVRNNTPMEDFHVEHHISDAEMAEFNKAVVNNIYSVLVKLFQGDATDRMKLAQVMTFEAGQVKDWDAPVDKRLVDKTAAFIQKLREMSR